MLAVGRQTGTLGHTLCVQRTADEVVLVVAVVLRKISAAFRHTNEHLTMQYDAIYAVRETRAQKQTASQLNFNQSINQSILLTKESTTTDSVKKYK